jgi:hypothetical protein
MSQNLPNDPSIELILVNIARKFAPTLVPQDWKRPGDLKKPLYTLARELANYHVLVILGERDNAMPQNNPVAVRETGEIYIRFYHLLAKQLFSSLPLRIDASYYSYSRATLMIMFDAEARGVIEVMAGYVAPYLVERQGSHAVAPAELQGLMDKILQKLDAGDSSQADYRLMREEGAEILKQMVAMRLRQLSLTRFDEPFFSEIQQPVPPPASLPEEEDTQRARPFVDQSSMPTPSEEPDFIKAMREPRQKPPEPPTLPEKPPAKPELPELPQLENQEPTSETGKDVRVNDQGEPNRPAPPPAPNSNSTIRPPIPYWRDDDQDEKK